MKAVLVLGTLGLQQNTQQGKASQGKTADQQQRHPMSMKCCSADLTSNIAVQNTLAAVSHDVALCGCSRQQQLQQQQQPVHASQHPIQTACGMPSCTLTILPEVGGSGQKNPTEGRCCHNVCESNNSQLTVKHRLQPAHHATLSWRVLAEKPVGGKPRLGVARHCTAALECVTCPAIKRAALRCLVLGWVCAFVIPVTGGALADASDAVTGNLEHVVVKGHGAGLACTIAAAATAAVVAAGEQQQQAGAVLLVS
jgi:hypothetical protein